MVRDTNGCTSAEDPNIVDLEQECTAFLIDQLILDYDRPTKRELLSLDV